MAPESGTERRLMGASRETGARFVTGLQEDIGAVVTIDRGEVGQTSRKGKWPSPSPTWLEGSVTRRQLPTRRINRPLECSQPRRRKRKTSCYGTVAIAGVMGTIANLQTTHHHGEGEQGSKHKDRSRPRQSKYLDTRTPTSPTNWTAPSFFMHLMLPFSEFW